MGHVYARMRCEGIVCASCVHVCARTHVRGCVMYGMCGYVYVRGHVHSVCVYMCAYVGVCMCVVCDVYGCMRICVCVCVCAHAPTHTLVYVRARMWACVCA